MAEVREMYSDIFPTLLGIKLAGRMDEKVYKKLLDEVNSLEKVGDARAQVMMSSMADQLKASVQKEYEADLSKLE